MSDEELLNKIYSLSEKEIHERYKFLGEGISRKVYALNEKYVVKVAKGREGFYQNKVECYVYTHASPHLRTYLCPILRFTPRILIMKRATPLSKIMKGKTVDLQSIRPEETAFEDLNYLASKYFLYYEDILSITSWGQLDDTNMLIDYGCTNGIGDLYYDLLFLRL